MDTERTIELQLIKLGVPPHILGFKYLQEALSMSLKDESIVNSMTKVLYPSIADKFNTTGSRVERAIRHAIEVACDRCDLTTWQNLFGYSISYDKGKPTNSQAIATLVLHLKDQLKTAPTERSITMTPNTHALNDERMKHLMEASAPLVEFLYKYGCPHSCVIVTQTSAELMSGECAIPIEPRD